MFSIAKPGSRVGFLGLRYVCFDRFFSPHKRFIQILSHRKSKWAILLSRGTSYIVIAPVVSAVGLDKLSLPYPK